ncbi:MAG: hypothetical protein WDM78_07750 [Puia sp.]
MTTIKTINADTANPQIRTAYLLNGFIRNNLTEKEHDELDEWVCENIVNQRVFEVMTEGLMELNIGY